MFHYPAAFENVRKAGRFPVPFADKQAHAHVHTHTQTDRHRTGVDVGMSWNKALYRTIYAFVCLGIALIPTLSQSHLLLHIPTPLRFKIFFFFVSSIHNTPCPLSQRSSEHPCGLDLLEKATRHWLKLGSITNMLRNYSGSLPTLCHFTPQSYICQKSVYDLFLHKGCPSSLWHLTP